MNGSIRDCARLGLVHHMLYDADTAEPERHADSLIRFSQRQDIETFDCCLPYAPAPRRRVVKALQECGKEIVVSAHQFPVRKISFATTHVGEKALVKMALQEQAALAGEVKASGFVFPSGGPGPDREAAKKAFLEFCQWFVRELHKVGVKPMLEPFDTEVDKKFLYGPIAECVALVRQVGPEIPLHIELDLAHLPLMRENLEDAVRATAPYLARVHLGNCVLKDPSHPLYGDKHPPIGFEGGEIDVPEVARFLRALVEVGYLDKAKRNGVVLETIPFPGKSPEFTIADGFRKVDAAWAMA